MGPAQAALLQGFVITQHDLELFHAKHFPNAPLPAQQVGENLGPIPAADHGEHEDLGYYADGTKRYLTDQDIAFFRRSELQRFLREMRKRRELRSESIEVSFDEGEVLEEDTNGLGHPHSTEPFSIIAQPDSAKSSRQNNASANFTPYGANSTKRARSGEPTDATASNVGHTKKKRKKRPNKEEKRDPKLNWTHWDEPAHGQSHLADKASSKPEITREEAALMPRRIARELDSSNVEDVELDYG